MSELQIAWLELVTVGGLGAILALFGVIINIVTKKQNKLCTKHTEGIVVQHGFSGEGRMYPIVEYFVNSTCYKTRKKFRGVKIKRISGLPAPISSGIYEDEKGWLYVKIGPVANLHKLAE